MPKPFEDGIKTDKASSIDWSALTPDVLLLTPNKRLSREVRKQHDHYQRAQATTAWASLNGLSVDTWLSTLWEALLFAHPEPLAHRLSQTQEALVWQGIVQRTQDETPLFNPLAAASSASEAWHTLVQWQQDPLSVKTDTPFEQWARTFQETCDEHGWIDRSSANQQTIALLGTVSATLPSTLWLVGFDDVTPQLHALLKALAACGIEHQWINPRLEHSTQHHTQALTFAHEISACARWAKQIVTREPDAKIGIVVPGLSAERRRVLRRFSEQFEPQAIRVDTEQRASGVNISVGEPLSQTPLIHAALLSLSLNRPSLPMSDVIQWLHSPFIAHESEQLARSEWADKLNSRHLELSLSDLAYYSGREAELPLTHQLLSQRLAHAIKLDQRHSAQEWAALFSRQLTGLGWPGARALNTLEHQQYQRWQEAFTAFTEIDYINPSLSLLEALERLKFVCSEQQFQPQTNDSPVQILGVFEAAGLQFDYLWVTGCDSTQWPAPVRPNPLIPIELQKSQGMPKASAVRELQLAKNQIEGFSHNAKQVIFSYAAMVDDAEREVSRLVKPFEQVTLEQLAPAETTSAWPNYEQIVNPDTALTELVDDKLAPLTASHTMTGGSQIIKNQAACPFRAAAIHRLGATQREPAQPGLNAAERGSLLHDALSVIWHQLKDHRTLCAIDPAELEQLMTDSIQQALSNLKRSIALGERSSALETQRLTQLIQQWLTLEKQRTPFSVRHNETEVIVTLAGLPIKLRYDRVDALDNGPLFVIDYKTGQVNINQWAGDRPDEPQVPLYCLANQEQVAAGAFAQINADAVRFIGLSDDTNIAPGLSDVSRTKAELPDDWPSVLTHWRDTIGQLATDFLQGRAAVNPKTNSTCRYCDVSRLCRINEYIPREDE